MKIMVLYYSKTGNTRKMAEIIAKGMEYVKNTQVKICSIEEIDEAWAKESKCIVLGSPIYVSSVSAAVKNWLDGPCKKCQLAGKLGGAFATADYIHGGGDLGIRLILDHMMVYGMMTFSGGSAYGKPVIHLGPVALSNHLEESTETFLTYGKRMATKAVELFDTFENI
ncbi:MAG: flavodoxin family protein [Lachnospiraceae bacterium]